MSSNNLSMDSMQELFNVMKDSPCMRVLNLRNNNYTSEEVTAVDPILSLIVAIPSKHILI